MPGYPAPHSPYSHAVVANGFVFVSGQIPVKPGGGPTEIAGATMAEQTRQCLRNVETILEAAGSSLERVVKTTVLLTRPELYQEMNAAYAEFFPGKKPARAMARFGADSGHAGRDRGGGGDLGRGGKSTPPYVLMRRVFGA